MPSDAIPVGRTAAPSSRAPPVASPVVLSTPLPPNIAYEGGRAVGRSAAPSQQAVPADRVDTADSDDVVVMGRGQAPPAPSPLSPPQQGMPSPQMLSSHMQGHAMPSVLPADAALIAAATTVRLGGTPGTPTRSRLASAPPGSASPLRSAMGVAAEAAEASRTLSALEDARSDAQGTQHPAANMPVLLGSRRRRRRRRMTGAALPLREYWQHHLQLLSGPRPRPPPPRPRGGGCWVTQWRWRCGERW